MPISIAITPDGSKAYVTNAGHSTVSVINIQKNKVVKTIYDPNFSGTWGITITPDGSKTYVANRGGSEVSVIDTKKNKVIKTISSPNFIAPYAIAVLPAPILSSSSLKGSKFEEQFLMQKDIVKVVSWDSIFGATNYLVYDENGNLLATTPANQTTFEHHGRKEGKSDTYQINYILNGLQEIQGASITIR